MFDLGPYAFYIWPCYAVSAIGLIGATIWTLSTYAAAKAKLKALEEKKA